MEELTATELCSILPRFIKRKGNMVGWMRKYDADSGVILIRKDRHDDSALFTRPTHGKAPVFKAFIQNLKQVTLAENLFWENNELFQKTKNGNISLDK